MAASTKRFSLTDATYVDVSEGASFVYFILEFNPNSQNAIRLAVGQALPAVGTVHYQAINPGRFPVGSDNFSQEVPVKFELGDGDRVYVRAEREACDVVVHRK